MNDHSGNRRVRQNFSRAAAQYTAHAILQAEVESRTLERLDYFQLQPATLLELGCGPGRSLPVLESRYPRARKLYLDFAEPMLRQLPRPRRFRKRTLFPVAGDMHFLPFADNSTDLIVSSLALQWATAPAAVLRECFRVLKPHGLLLFSTLGPETLHELASLTFQQQHLVRVNQFPDMHDLGDLLVRSGFADPVLDCERICLEYSSAREVLRDLKHIGANTALAPSPSTPGSPAGLRGRRWLSAVETAYAQHRRGDAYPATFEIVYGQASRPPSGARPQDGSTVPAGEVHIPVDALTRHPRRGSMGD